MAFEKQIVETIAGAIAAVLASKKFEPVIVDGIAETKVTIQGQRTALSPAIREGKALKAITPNTKVGVHIYHKLLQVKKDRAKKSFGNSHDIKQVVDLEMICILNRNSPVSALDLEKTISSAIPQRMSAEMLTKYKIRHALILPTGTSYDELKIARQEFVNYEPPISQHTFISIKISATLTYDPACAKCEC